ncbi:hypothetical protein EC957_000530, partial [Mortierella hygrophila]
MSSPPPQGNSPSPPPAPSSPPLGHPEITVDGHRVLSQLENTAALGGVSLKTSDVPTITQGLAIIQLGPANLLNPLGHRTTRDVATDVDHGPVSSGHSSKFGFRKRLSRFLNGDPKVKETAPASAASSAPVTLVGTEGHIQSAAPHPDA